MEALGAISALLRADPLRWRLLGMVRDLRLPDAWIGAGFIRNAVWDHLHGRAGSGLHSDVDVIWYDPVQTDPEIDRTYETLLLAAEPGVAWSVKNQARMHKRNGDPPYSSTMDAMRYWPETATALAARRDLNNECHIAAPLGAEDLMNLVLRPTPHFVRNRMRDYHKRVQEKGWTSVWPRLTLVAK
ncbi:nucleotidyltransferase family protein [Acetobacter orleanensis]|uniref:Nitrate reductase n=1 Tax=Acetobacter orleanensis TaxID=104099 RepID=A0A4Y3TKW6_9PROT|nr:nucleotidyltransferase family protein [Acetobacter orleanensis]KXV62989.1 hypothetical protein AD949_08105 [Acetobacter orleanensis]PCD79303.1 hypothetical protein CO710_06460 [Acetobacter orleanensis]GAN69703.1 hypothetical protein Abol_053_012 [Acetobacter orleanensis JCM 7639]GEB82404.1 hypothetical protein AOR01nite_08810 [Acetobacter orleanensis]